MDEPIERCETCEVEGYGGPSGLPGVLVAPPFTSHGHRVIERCDACKRYPNDMEAASAWLQTHGGTWVLARLGGANRIVWSPPGVPGYADSILAERIEGR